MKRSFLKTMLWLFIVSVILRAQALPDSSQLATLDKFWQEHPDWYVCWDKATGTPASMYGTKTKSFGKTPESAIQNFLLYVNKLFERKNNSKVGQVKSNLQKPNLSFISQRNSINGNYYDYQQEYKNIPINGTQCTFGVTENGEIFYFSGIFYSEQIDINTTPNVSFESAFTTAVFNIGKVGFVQRNKKLYILPNESKFELVWDFFLVDENSGESWKYIVSASSGKIISRSDSKINSSESDIIINGLQSQNQKTELLLNYQSPHGLIFNTYPQSSSLEFETSLVQLPLLNSSGYLQGTYVNVYKTSGSRATYISGDPNNFTHSPYTQNFDEVNVYYHISKFRQNFINNFYTPSFNQTNVSIGWNESERKSYYNPGFDVIYFYNGVPEDPNFSREANVIYHEYIHKIQYDIGCEYLNSSATNEYKGVLEGLSDYFAYMYSGVPDILTYSLPSQARSINNHSSYNSSLGIYPFGQLFSHILSHLQSIFGFQNVLFAQMNNFNNYNSAFLSFRDRLINGFYDSSTKNTIRNTFAEHGVGDYANNPPSPPTNVSISGSYGSNPTIQWTPPNDPDINHYKIYRKKYNESSFTLVGLTSGTSFTDYDITVQYNFIEDDIYYYVKTVDNDGALSSESIYVNVLDIWASRSIVNTDSIKNKNIVSKEQTLFDLNISNYPNPFNPVTTISFSVPEESDVLIKIHNLLGQELETIYNDKVTPGKYNLHWDGSKYSSGLYLITIQTNSAIRTLKVMLAK
ncbi:MAG: T9SS type A sorting domain-containing protein [Melioribacter sp.]|nr:T9SS type A sorting domain-containing protein [Melioribacter sp.]